MGTGDVLDEVLGVGPVSPVWAWSEATLIARLDEVHALAQRVLAAQLLLIREVDGRGIARAQGAVNTRTWLRERHRISGTVAGRLVKLAEATDDGHELAVTGAALAAGAVNGEQVQAIRDALGGVPRQHWSEAEKLLLAEAAVHGPAELAAAGPGLLATLDPAEAERRERQGVHDDETRRQRRHFTLTDQAGTGMVKVTGLLDPEDAAAVRAAIGPLCAPRTRRDPDGQIRTAGECRADAIGEICRLALATGALPEHGGDRPQVTITMSLDTLRDQVGAATLGDGTLLSPAAARRLACDAKILPAVLGGASQVIDVGREQRLVSGYLRRALVLRDRGCVFPGCDRPPRWTEGHHMIHWADGGLTDLANTCLLCGHHHRLVHDSDWYVRLNLADGLPEIIPPAYLDPDRIPMRNSYHQRD